MEKQNVSLEQLEVKRITKTFLWIMILFRFSSTLFAPVFLPYVVSKGLTAFHFNIILAITMFTIFLFEIPTGAFADLLGRRRSFIVSLLLMVCAKIIFMFSNTVLGFGVGAFIDGLAFAFFSGSIDAWAIDEVKKRGVTDFQQIFAKVGSLTKMASIAGGFVGGYLIQQSWGLVWMLSAAILIALIYVAIRLMDEEDMNSDVKYGFKEGLMKIKDILKISLKVCVDNKFLAFLILIQSYEIFWVGGSVHLWSKYLPDIFGVVWIISWVWVILAVGSIIGNSIVGKLKLNFEEKIRLVMAGNLLRIGLLFIAGTVSHGALVIAALFAMNTVSGVKVPLMNTLFNENIDHEYRSTILSFRSQINSLFHNCGLLVMGWVAQSVSIAFSWQVAGIMYLGVFVIWILMKPKFAIKSLVQSNV